MARLLGDGWEPGPATADGAGVAPSAAPVAAEPPTAEAVWAALEAVPDPEVPVISVVELGVVRDVAVGDAGRVTVTITPTYSGCPAMREIERDVAAALAARGWMPTVRTTYTPAWTTDWMSDVAREKLRTYGIAPPGRGAEPALVPLRRRGGAGAGGAGAAGAAPAVPTSLPCPRCGSPDTALQSAFGATACKALYACRACGEPFEAFKAV